MERRRPIGWYSFLLATYLLAISVAILALDRDAIFASHPAYALTLLGVAVIATAIMLRSLFRRC